MIRFILYFLVFLLIFRLLRSVIEAMVRPSKPVQDTRRADAAAELMRDPVCGTYVAAASSVTSVVGGKTVYFCSEECRGKYQG